MRLFYQGLVRANPRTGNPEAEIAEKWEQPTQTDYIFSLAPGIKWHNKAPASGRLLTADDVVFALKRISTDDPRFIHRSLLSPIQTIEAVNKSTVKITTRQPDVTTLAALTALNVAILNPEAVEKAAGKFATADTGVGTGAFILDTFDETGAKLIRNPDYWKPGLPYLDGVNLPNFKDPESRWAAFLAKQLHVGAVPGSDAKKFSAEQANNYHMEWVSDVTLFGNWPNSKKKPFDDPRVTRALRLLIDHSEAVTGHAEVWYGRGRLSSYLPTALESWDFTEQEMSSFLEWKQPKTDAVREALSLLSAAGFNRDNPLRFRTIASPVSWYQAHAELLQAQWHRLGQGAVQTELDMRDTGSRDAVVARDEHDYVIHGMTGPFPEPDLQMRSVIRSDGGRNYSRFGDPALDALIDRQRVTFDLNERKRIIKDALRYAVERAPQTSWTGRYILDAQSLLVRDRAPEVESSVFGFQYEHVWLDT
jgi:peptide/nickel transport system substrate-binding protein